MTFRYYNVKVNRVVDGDTVHLDIDMGNNTHWTDTFRLYGIDTPERGKAGYNEATNYLKSCCEKLSFIETYKQDKYGRWLVDLYMDTESSGIQNINKSMISLNLAKPYFGGTKE